jgi:hypothetical protein
MAVAAEWSGDYNAGSALAKAFSAKSALVARSMRHRVGGAVVAGQVWPVIGDLNAVHAVQDRQSDWTSADIKAQ